MTFCFGDEPAHYAVGDHVLPVGDVSIVFEDSECDFDVILLGIEVQFLVSEQLISCGEVVDHPPVLGGGAKDRLALYEGDCIAGKELVPGLTGLTGLARNTRVWELYALAELYVMILTGAESMCRYS